MGPAGRLTLAFLSAGVSLGCRASPPSALPALPPARPPVTAPEPELAPCPGGLLCEDPELLGGFRVPLGCVRGYDGQYTKTCTVRGLRPPELLGEFLLSRYPARREGDSWWVEVAGIGALRVQPKGETAEFVAMPWSATPAERP